MSAEYSYRKCSFQHITIACYFFGSDTIKGILVDSVI